MDFFQPRFEAKPTKDLKTPFWTTFDAPPPFQEELSVPKKFWLSPAVFGWPQLLSRPPPPSNSQPPAGKKGCWLGRPLPLQHKQFPAHQYRTAGGGADGRHGSGSEGDIDWGRRAPPPANTATDITDITFGVKERLQTGGDTPPRWAERGGHCADQYFAPLDVMHSLVLQKICLGGFEPGAPPGVESCKMVCRLWPVGSTVLTHSVGWRSGIVC